MLLPTLLSKEITHYACIVLFAFFGVRLLYDVYTSEPAAGESEELKEVEMELSLSRDELESGPGGSVSPSRKNRLSSAVGTIRRRLAAWWQVNESRKVFLQAFVMTFLAEWGDRSQIATIALASAKDPIGVTLGGIIGHSLCTGVAVIGGKLLASKISERHVNLAGGCLFLFFAAVSLAMGADE